MSFSTSAGGRLVSNVSKSMSRNRADCFTALAVCRRASGSTTSKSRYQRRRSGIGALAERVREIARADRFVRLVRDAHAERRRSS